MTWKKCPWCATYFIPVKRQTYCSPKCRRKFYNTMIRLETEREIKDLAKDFTLRQNA